MSDGIKIDPPGQTLGKIATTDDEQIENVLGATKTNTLARHDAGASDAELGDARTVVWAIQGWQGARAGLVALREYVLLDATLSPKDRAEMLTIIAEGLEVSRE